MTEATFRVPDMSCAHCKAAVEVELNRLPGVESSNADVEKGTVEVSYDESRVGTEELEGAIEEAGYTVAA
jgi:copper ion binding protein